MAMAGLTGGMLADAAQMIEDEGMGDVDLAILATVIGVVERMAGVIMGGTTRGCGEGCFNISIPHIDYGDVEYDSFDPTTWDNSEADERSIEYCEQMDEAVVSALAKAGVKAINLDGWTDETAHIVCYKMEAVF